MIILWICLVLFVLYFIVYETWWGLSKYKNIIKGINEGKISKIKLYARMILGLWIPAGAVIFLCVTNRFTLNDLGLRWFKFTDRSWFLYIMGTLAVLYFLYLGYSLIILRIYAIKKLSINQKIPDNVKVLLPISNKEKRVWFFTAITAGITEELLYRGFLFYLLAALFPGLNIFIILIISSLTFGIGHLYQGVSEAVKPMLLGLVYGMIFIAFGTIIPCIILHAMQDLCAIDLIHEEGKN